MTCWRCGESLQRNRGRRSSNYPRSRGRAWTKRRIRILDALHAESRVSFRALAGETVDQVVATFLAVLELFRRGQIAVEQPLPFGDIVLSLTA